MCNKEILILIRQKKIAKVLTNIGVFFKGIVNFTISKGPQPQCEVTNNTCPLDGWRDLRFTEGR